MLFIIANDPYDVRVCCPSINILVLVWSRAIWHENLEISGTGGVEVI
jgi:hypothetical protein